MKRNVLNIDLDGTLTDGSLFWETEPKVNKEMRTFVKEAYYSSKYVIIIWTARLWHDAGKTVGWLISNDIPFHGIMMQKSASDVYIDDKMIHSSDKVELQRLLTEDMEAIPLCGKITGSKL